MGWITALHIQLPTITTHFWTIEFWLTVYYSQPAITSFSRVQFTIAQHALKIKKSEIENGSVFAWWLPYKSKINIYFEIPFLHHDQTWSRPNSPAAKQDFNGTLMDNTSIKWAIKKNFFLFFIQFWWNMPMLYLCVLQLHQVSSKSNEKQKKFYKQLI